MNKHCIQISGESCPVTLCLGTGCQGPKPAESNCPKLIINATSKVTTRERVVPPLVKMQLSTKT
jgi:hypothetical protein